MPVIEPCHQPQSRCRQHRPLRQRRRRERLVAAATTSGGMAAIWMGLVASSLSGASSLHSVDMMEESNNSAAVKSRQRHLRHHHHQRGDVDSNNMFPSLFLSNSGMSTTSNPPRRSMKTCLPNQHAFILTMYTDAHSISDNSWRISHAASSSSAGDNTSLSGLEIHRESVGSGNLGYGAVVIDTFCADKASSTVAASSSPSSTFVESCYDIELFDANGDGLTSSWGAVEGLSGGFSLSLDGVAILEHRSRACTMTVDDNEWSECAIANGFEYCGLRVCTTASGAEVSGSATVSNLSGSQCSVFQPQCLSGGTSSSTSSSSTPLSASSILVQVETDSFANELSWELRVSSKSDSTSMKRAFDNELLLAGGMPFYQETETSSNIMLGQPGVGVSLQDQESYNSTACLTADHSSVKCYDFRAYDKYGDGLGCGADGSLSIVLETAVSDDRREKLTVTQKDRNMAKRQEVDGKKKLACMDTSGLSKWNYCAVRICTDGTVIALEGNQCDFGMGEDLIDSRFADIDPLSGLTMRPWQDEMPEEDDEVIKLEDAMPEEEEVEPIEVEDLDFDVTEEFIVKDVEKVNREEDVDQTWAEYYEALEPGLRGDDPQAAFAQPNQDDEPNQDGEANQEDMPTMLHGVKGPRKDKDRPQEKIAEFADDEEEVEVDHQLMDDDDNDEDDDSKKLTRIQRLKIKKQRERQKKQHVINVRNQDESESEMNVMGYVSSSRRRKKERNESDESESEMNVIGYVSSSQRKNERSESDDDEVYDIMDGDLMMYVQEEDNR